MSTMPKPDWEVIAKRKAKKYALKQISTLGSGGDVLTSLYTIKKIVDYSFTCGMKAGVTTGILKERG